VNNCFLHLNIHSHLFNIHSFIHRIKKKKKKKKKKRKRKRKRKKPEQASPVPLNPSLQVQTKLPTAFEQSACEEHGYSPVVHSSISNVGYLHVFFFFFSFNISFEVKQNKKRKRKSKEYHYK